jgi:hypothetical protein
LAGLRCQLNRDAASWFWLLSLLRLTATAQIAERAALRA